MAKHFFGINKGNKFTTVTDATSTTSKDIELTVELTSDASREQVIVALQNLRDYILQNSWPPA
jgi:NACalpha-BTF3-like transcription factor